MPEALLCETEHCSSKWNSLPLSLCLAQWFSHFSIRNPLEGVLKQRLMGSTTRIDDSGESPAWQDAPNPVSVSFGNPARDLPSLANLSILSLTVLTANISHLGASIYCLGLSATCWKSVPQQLHCKFLQSWDPLCPSTLPLRVWSSSQQHDSIWGLVRNAGSWAPLRPTEHKVYFNNILVG